MDTERAKYLGVVVRFVYSGIQSDRTHDITGKALRRAALWSGRVWPRTEGGNLETLPEDP